MAVPNGVTGSPLLGNEVVPNGGLTKDIKDNIQKKGESVKRPTYEEVLEYFTNHKSLPLAKDPVCAEKFFNHYEANGWVQSNGMKIKKWRAAASGWILRMRQYETKNGSGGLACDTPFPSTY